MKFPGPESTRPPAAPAGSAPSGLAPEHKAALAQATDMMAQGQPPEVAVDHLVDNGMPKLVAKVLVKQLDKRS